MSWRHHNSSSFRVQAYCTRKVSRMAHEVQSLNQEKVTSCFLELSLQDLKKASMEVLSPWSFGLEAQTLPRFVCASSLPTYILRTSQWCCQEVHSTISAILIYWSGAYAQCKWSTISQQIMKCCSSLLQWWLVTQILSSHLMSYSSTLVRKHLYARPRPFGWYQFTASLIYHVCAREVTCKDPALRHLVSWFPWRCTLVTAQISKWSGYKEHF